MPHIGCGNDEEEAMNHTVRTLSLLTILASALAAGGTATAAVASTTDKVSIQSLKDKGYSCEHAATNMTTCTKSGEKDQTCSESEDSCVVLHTGPKRGQYQYYGPARATTVGPPAAAGSR
jgi:hypothetical protein